MNAAVEPLAHVPTLSEAVRVAAEHAGAVDAGARFPAEAVAALARARRLGAMVPRELGGEGETLREAAATSFALGAACGSTALIHAMHQIQVATVLLAAARDPWQLEFLRRIAEEQMLLASVTSEEGIGGNVRTSTCAVAVSGGRFVLDKRSPSISYGAHADALLVTARAHAGAPPSDQVMVTALPGEYRLERTGSWDTLGMRGTCSDAFALHAEGDAAQVCAVSYAELSERAMLPASHLLWSAAWLGIAHDALGRARAFLRARARSAGEAANPGLRRLEAAASRLRGVHARTLDGLERHGRRWLDPEAPADLGFTIEMNGLKVLGSTEAVHAVGEAMQVIGIAAYKLGTPFSLGRHLRDIHSAPLMVNNDRIAANAASLLLAQRSPMMVF